MFLKYQIKNVIDPDGEPMTLIRKRSRAQLSGGTTKLLTIFNATKESKAKIC